MHASIEQLLNLRDGAGPGESALQDHVDECRECEQELLRLTALKDELRSLPQLQPSGDLSADSSVDPSADQWAAIVRRAGQETQGARRPGNHYWPLGLAASLVIAALVALLLQGAPDDIAGESPVTMAANSLQTTVPSTAAANTAQLVAESQRLERLLGTVSYEPRVVNAGTAGTIAQLEDQIAWVDYGLSMGGGGRLSASEANALWRQRVELMNSLVHVRYAQAQRIDF